ncbi:MAG: tyrosinase family protein [Pseudonocardia sp.]
MIARPSVESANVVALRDAFTKMQALSGNDNRSWIFWAGVHGFPRNACWHHGRVDRTQFPYDLFLPWHRAYLLYVENVARDHNPDAVLPWWDWSSALSHQVGVPVSYSQANAGGQRNPLATGPVPPMQGAQARRTRRFPGRPAALPTRQRVTAVRALTSFVDFTTQLQDIHDEIHGWTGGRDPANPVRGGDMGTVRSSAFDPIFWAHHCMIDRIWYLWQLDHGVNNIPPSYLNRPLAPFDLTVADVLNINSLGYEYAVARVPVPVGGGG